ncbi:hypothetical protein FPZ12_020270 [Amycolatopsis acidicola]|uniref:Uncharacterized protein n=1 Tax=Amycolatopsis acidicola TaxID=2596893 RepID=A0A5N0UZM4_9PSEU|nr:hypothetical protein [Amycolatopsis acidicola]KAA9159440.1 hypothetical protein FPZ12_020270 [Amycolatopsis acidicola]
MKETLMSYKGEHVYSPKQYAETVELWRELLECDRVSLAEDRTGYLYPIRVQDLTDDVIHALVLSDGQETDDDYAITVTLVDYSDYGGTERDAANVRYLIGTPGVQTSTNGRHGYGSAWVQLGELPTNGDDVGTGIEWLTNLIQIAQSIDAGEVDESTLGEYETELQVEAWDAWLESDTRSELADWFGCDDLDDFGYSHEEIRDLYYSYEGNEWTCDSATSATNQNHDDAVEHVAETILAAWCKPYVDPNQTTLSIAV